LILTVFIYRVLHNLFVLL